MKIEKAYLLGIHPNAFRAGEPAEITGVSLVSTNSNVDPRACYMIRFSDGIEDNVPLIDSQAYRVISFNEILTGEYKEYLL